MKAIQIDKYTKEINTVLWDIPVPKLNQSEVLLKVKTAAVNPLELLILISNVRLIQNYSMPLTLENKCSGVIEAVGQNVTDFHIVDKVIPVYHCLKSVPL